MEIGTLISVNDFNGRKGLNFRDVVGLLERRLTRRVVVEGLDGEKVSKEPEFGSFEGVESVCLSLLAVESRADTVVHDNESTTVTTRKIEMV